MEDKDMDKCINELVIKRCEYATSNSKSLCQLDDSDDVYAARAMAEQLCYQQGFKDAIEFVKTHGFALV